jgi:hypothetical protein
MAFLLAYAAIVALLTLALERLVGAAIRSSRSLTMALIGSRRRTTQTH